MKTFCKNQENLCTFETKFLNRQKKKENGVDIGEEKPTKPALLEVLHSGDNSEIRLTITEGRFHQVKRMFEAVGKKVTYLKRVEMGSLVLPDELAPGEYRPLTEEELQELRRH